MGAAMQRVAGGAGVGCHSNQPTIFSASCSTVFLAPKSGSFHRRYSKSEQRI